MRDRDKVSREISSFCGTNNLKRNELSRPVGGKEDGNAPSVSLAFPPVGWHSTLVHEGQTTTVCACEKTVVMAKQPEKKRVKHEYYDRDGLQMYKPGHLTSIKYELGDCTRRLSLCCLA